VTTKVVHRQVQQQPQESEVVWDAVSRYLFFVTC
jgi:hypothetical protein